MHIEYGNGNRNDAHQNESPSNNEVVVLIDSANHNAYHHQKHINSVDDVVNPLSLFENFILIIFLCNYFVSRHIVTAFLAFIVAYFKPKINCILVHQPTV